MLSLRAGDAVAEVDPDNGGRLTRVAVGDAELLTAAGSFVMAPWAGRTGYGAFDFEGASYRLPVVERHAPHAIHGPVRDRAWVVEAADPLRVRISCDLGPEWPWPGWCEQQLTLAADGLELAVSVHAGPGARFPAVTGWHPWFVRPAEVDLRAHALLEKGDDRLPTGRLISPPPATGPFDDCFAGVDWPVVMRWASGLRLEVSAEGCDHVVYFDEPADAVCVEPQTGPPDGLRTGQATVVTPDEPLRAVMRWAWTAP